MEAAFKEIDATTIPIATDSLSAPLIYVDAIRGIAIGQETTKINLVQFRENALTGETNIVHAGTLVLPSSQIAAWAEYLSKLAALPPLRDQIKAAEEVAGNGA